MEKFSNITWSEEERPGTEQQVRFDRCYPIFESLRPGLIKDYYNWYLTIEPETREYF